MYVLHNNPFPHITTDGLIGPKLLTRIDETILRTDFTRWKGYDSRGGSRQKFQFNMSKEKKPLTRDDGTHPLEEVLDTRDIISIWDQAGKNVIDNYRLLNVVNSDDRPFNSVSIELVRSITPEWQTAYARYDTNRCQTIIMLRWQGHDKHLGKGFEVKLGKKAMGNLIPWHIGHSFTYIPDDKTTFVKYPVTSFKTCTFINVGLR